MKEAAKYDIGIGAPAAMMIRDNWHHVVLASDYDDLKRENERLRAGIAGGYDLDAWLDWAKEAATLRTRCAELERLLSFFVASEYNAEEDLNERDMIHGEAQTLLNATEGLPAYAALILQAQASGTVRPTGWATVRNGRVHAVGPLMPQHPGAIGWEYWESIGFSAPIPLYMGTPALSKAAIAGLLERVRQIGSEGWTTAHDDKYKDGSLARAAGCLALKAAGVQLLRILPFWPWERKWLKPATPYRDLEKAFALVLAEMERIDRKESESSV